MIDEVIKHIMSQMTEEDFRKFYENSRSGLFPDYQFEKTDSGFIVWVKWYENSR